MQIIRGVAMNEINEFFFVNEVPYRGLRKGANQQNNASRNEDKNADENAGRREKTK